jgi:hypothetical protein
MTQGSSVVEHTAHNRGVVGSNPAPATIHHSVSVSPMDPRGGGNFESLRMGELNGLEIDGLNDRSTWNIGPFVAGLCVGIPIGALLLHGMLLVATAPSGW